MFSEVNNSGASTPSLSPRKELNGRGGGSGGASSGAWSEGEGSSAGASVQGDDESDTQALLDLLSATRTPQVTNHPLPALEPAYLPTPIYKIRRAIAKRCTSYTMR